MNTGMKTDTDRDTDTGVGTARGAGAKQRQPQGEQRADVHANTAEGNTVEGNASSKKEMDTDKARDEARASNTITTISDKTTQKTATSPDMTTAVDPTTRTQLARADQAYARGNGDTADADAALHQVPDGQAVRGFAPEKSTTASKMTKGIRMDTDEATPSNTITTISDKIATSLNRTTAVDPTTRTQLARADQAYARGNGDTDDADAAHQAPVGQAARDSAQEKSTTASFIMTKGIMDTDEATPSNTSTTISDKIATSPNRATAVDPTTRTQITPADQARARGNQQADLAQNKKKNFSPSSLVPGHRLQQQMSSASVNAACAPLALAPAAGEAAGAPADVGFIASAPRAAEPSGRHRAGEKEPAPNRAPRGARIILDRPGPLPPVTAAATRVTITGSGARAPASERVVFATSRKSERGAKAGADDARCSCAVWKTVGDETAMKRSPGAKACRRRRHRRCWTTRARENKRRSALKTMLAVVPPLLLAALLWQMLAVEAVFTPRTRAELQGDGGAEKGVFGCVGKCGASLAGAGTAVASC